MGRIARAFLEGMLWALLVLFIALCAGHAWGQVTRIVPRSGAPYDPHLGSYMLPKALGVMQGFHEEEYFTNADLAAEVRQHGFEALKLWSDISPFTGMGPWEWEHFCGQQYISNHNGENMAEFWSAPGLRVITARFQHWCYWEGACCAFTWAPTYEITKRLLDEFGHLDKVIIFADWEQDWWPQGCADLDPDVPYQFPFEHYDPWYSGECITGCVRFGGTQEDCTQQCGEKLVEARFRELLDRIQWQQRGVERARREYFYEHLKHPKLRVMHAVVVNRFPGRVLPHETWPTLAERISGLTSKPDLIGVSYWVRGQDPQVALDWIKETTGYPRYRIYIDEFGGLEDEQVQRYEDYIPAFRDWGIRLINIWAWKQTWDAPDDPTKHWGLWKRLGRDENGVMQFGEPTAGYYKLQELLGGHF